MPDGKLIVIYIELQPRQNPVPALPVNDVNKIVSREVHELTPPQNPSPIVVVYGSWMELVAHDPVPPQKLIPDETTPGI